MIRAHFDEEGLFCTHGRVCSVCSMKTLLYGDSQTLEGTKTEIARRYIDT